MKVKNKDGEEVEVRYYYFGRGLWRRHHGIMTVGAIVTPGADGAGCGMTYGDLEIATAFCSPTDNFRRFSGEPRMEYVRDENGNRVNHSQLSATEQDEIDPNEVDPLGDVMRLNKQLGGLDIVNARLGLESPLDLPVKTYKGEYTGSMLQGVIKALNQLPNSALPQLWHKRMFVLAPRNVLYRHDCWTHQELKDTPKLTRPFDLQPGYFYVGNFRD